MEGFEIVAILVYIVIAGLIGLNRYLQGPTEEEDSSTDSPESPRPVSQPVNIPGPARAEPQQRAEPQRYDSPYQRPTQSTPRQDSPYQRRPQQPQPTPQSETKPDDDPLKPMRDILKEIFGAEEPEIVEKRPPKRIKKRRKPKQPQSEQPTVHAPMLNPAQLGEAPVDPRRNPFFAQLAKDAQENPLRSAVIFTEILKRPRAIRSAQMCYTHER